MEFLFQSATGDTLTVWGALITIFSAFFLGLLISFTYMKTFQRGEANGNFVITIVMVPAIIAIIILLVGSNVARAFSLAGAFSIIRFRSAPGDPKDITYIFFALAAGLACGVGLVGYAVLFVAVLCLFAALLSRLRFGVPRCAANLLKITVPEDLNYDGAFDDVLEQYSKNYALKKVRTTDLGSLYELVYHVTLKEDADKKEFLDLLRCKNGNLNITLLLDTTGE